MALACTEVVVAGADERIEDGNEGGIDDGISVHWRDKTAPMEQVDIRNSTSAEVAHFDGITRTPQPMGQLMSARLQWRPSSPHGAPLLQSFAPSCSFEEDAAAGAKTSGEQRSVSSCMLTGGSVWSSHEQVRTCTSSGRGGLCYVCTVWI